jgi:hypothetical protein
MFPCIHRKAYKNCWGTQRLLAGSVPHTSPYSVGIIAFFPGLNRPRHETNHSPQSSTEVKNEWSYTSTCPHVFIVCTGTSTDKRYKTHHKWRLNWTLWTPKSFKFSSAVSGARLELGPSGLTSWRVQQLTSPSQRPHSVWGPHIRLMNLDFYLIVNTFKLHYKHQSINL